MSAATEHGYARYSAKIGKCCRCDVCREAARLYRAAQRARRLASAKLVHGLRSSYDCGCRCEECKGRRHKAYISDSMRGRKVAS